MAHEDELNQIRQALLGISTELNDFLQKIPTTLEKMNQNLVDLNNRLLQTQAKQEEVLSKAEGVMIGTVEADKGLANQLKNVLDKTLKQVYQENKDFRKESVSTLQKEAQEVQKQLQEQVTSRGPKR
jgi:epoxyqueuosine reductase QueG